MLNQIHSPLNLRHLILRRILKLIELCLSQLKLAKMGSDPSPLTYRHHSRH